MEDESRHIGKVFMSAPFYEQLRQAPILFLDIEAPYRLPHLVEVYAQYPKELLAQALEKIKKRMGGQHFQEAVIALENNNFSLVAELTLHYYDKAYLHGLEQRTEASIQRLELKTLDTKSQTDAVIQQLSINFMEK